MAATVELSAAALLIGLPTGLALGIFGAWRQRSVADKMSTVVAISGISLPIFWVGLMMVYLFSVVLGWFPLGGRLPAFSEFESRSGIYTVDALLQGDLAGLGIILRHLALPAVTLAIVPTALIARYARASFIDVLGENYIRTARAYGIRPVTIIGRLAAKNAVLPLITVMGLIVPSLLVGTVLVEIVFSWPGVGRFLLDALTSRDYIVVQSMTLLVGVLYVIVNLLADLSYAVLDPRTRRS
jgi:ABC-type dipeptide/oligopeptide/nickel transport system permease component